MSANSQRPLSPFDHGHLAAVPEYRALLRAISSFARVADYLDERELVQAVTDAAEALGFAEPCPRCGNGPVLRLTAPSRLDVDPETGAVTCAYRCARCAVAWPATYLPADDQAPELGSAPTRKGR